MRFYLEYIPRWYQKLNTKLTWRINRRAGDNVIYLTFDDGPIPGVTPWVLDMLDHYQAKATFFCIGDNARKHPELLTEIQERGHSIGNHTFNHLRGSKFATNTYLENIKACDPYFKSSLFRPPYGSIKREQARSLIQAGYEIIMWDVLAGDWDAKREPEDCLEAIKKHARNGSIVVFHDSIKSWPRLKDSLPATLRYLKEEGYQFRALKPQNTLTAE